MAQRLNVRRVAKIVADAEVMGTAKAAEKWKVTRRSVERYCKAAREHASPELSESVAEEREELSAECTRARRASMLSILKKIDELVLLCNRPVHLRLVVEAMEKIGEWDTTSMALGQTDAGGTDSSREDRPAQAHQGAPGKPSPPPIH